MTAKVPALSATANTAASLASSKSPHVEVVGPWAVAKSVLAVQVAEVLGVPMLIVAPGRIEAEAIHDDCCTFCGEDRAVLVPAWEVLPSDTMNPADDIVAERMNALERLAAAQDAEEPVHAVVPVRSLLQYVAARKQLMGEALRLAVGEEYDLDDLLDRLIKMGYVREVMVEARGEISVRGGIVDIFPISGELPCRVEFFGDEVESIRRFEPETQRSICRADAIQVLPRSEKVMLTRAAEGGQSLADVSSYLPKGALIVFDEPVAVAEEAEAVAEQVAESPYYMDWESALERIRRHPRLDLAQVGYGAAEGVTRVSFPTRSIENWAGKIQDFWEQLRQWDADGYAVRLFCVNSGERRRLHELLEEQGYRLGQDAFDLRLEIGRLRAGFASPKDKLAVLSEREMFGRHYVRRSRRRFEAGTAITQFSDLKAGDYIVHRLHGIGRYLGLRRFEGKAGDFMAVQYAGGDTVYVPATHIDQVQKYIGGDGSLPKVDKIGGATWARKKARVKKAVREMAEQLIKLYAARESRPGHAFPGDTPWQAEFDDAFPYDETPDQARAITDMKRDMEAARPMDRLLCGDVGYGKTEVALRGAFKAVMGGRQVALLAPTTVLTQQHYNTFRERLADFPVQVGLLNRFRTPKQQRDTISRLRSGEVDIVIGTHRLVSKDVGFKDLGLVIVDEEQRFGVGHKEKLKQFRTHVDVLTMSATPIPRTLHFSLIGVRDMSAINTAPNDRLPIHTCIEAWDENLIREAIDRELSRQGQVFFLHNRVQTIDRMAVQVNKLVPRARVAIGHGQMPKHELEDVMTAFVDGAVDVLVCTTIIGSGIDIPNANTIIINRADMFGLSELYQIRGRVGRYKNRAFAYLLIPGDRALSEEAQQRLKALEDFSALGSGFRVAMRDLEIRGAGDLLGAEQSGHIVTVGYETYKDLIAEAVAELRGEPIRRRQLPPFEIAVDAFVPEQYVPTDQQKMTLYRRIAGVQSVEEVDELKDELADRYGPPPNPVLRLIEVMRVRAEAVDFGVKRIVASNKSITVEFESSRFLSRRAQHQLQHAFGDGIACAWQDVPSLQYALQADDPPLETARRLIEALGDLS